MQTTRRTIDSGWRFRELEPRGNSEASDLPWMPAQVPGHVHLDLMRAGVIQDPFTRMAERACAWVDETDWVYETTFTVEDAVPAHAHLVFNGLDTIAEIALNGEPLGQTDNMFIPHEFAVGGKLRAGENTLQVIFRSALTVGRERQQAWADSGNDTLPRPHWFTWGPRSFVRKAQYMYGWDWGPELVSCGIWRPVELVTVPVARLLDWKYDVEFTSDDKAIVTIEAEIERAPGQEGIPIKYQAHVNGRRGGPSPEDMRLLMEIVETDVPQRHGRVSSAVTVEIDHPWRWYPNGMKAEREHSEGYFLEMCLIVPEVGLVESVKTHIGLRTVELTREPDKDGTGEGFRFRVNGEDIFVKGANWIPTDSFPSREQLVAIQGQYKPEIIDHRLTALLTAARDSGFNMLRVWGGGLYESETFYRLCDRLGILVWQDFPYGCAYYPDSPEYLEAARKEAEAAVRRIRNHPSLALWCGNNENSMLWHDHWEGADDLAPRYLGEKIYNEVLPAVLKAEDPKTPYWPSSPYGGENPNSQDQGDRHDWDVWHGVGDWIHYPEDDSRFLSEFGFASSCGMTAWDKCLAPEDKWPRSPAVRWHDKTRKGYETYLGYVTLHFPEPQTLEDLVYYSQLNQAEALKFGIEHWRRRKGRCWGTLFWQINDCWPVQSWAVIDSELEPKAAYYAAKRFYAPVLVSLVRVGDEVEAHLTSDLLEAIQGDVTVSIESFDGDVLTSETFEASVEANGTTAAGRMSVESVKAHSRDVYVHARFEPYWDLGIGAVENFLFLAEPKDLRLANPGVEMRIEESGQDLTLVLSAKRFAPYAWVRIPGRTRVNEGGEDDNFFHLRAGVEKRLLVSKDDLIRTAEDIRGRIIIRSL